MRPVAGSTVSMRADRWSRDCTCEGQRPVAPRHPRQVREALTVPVDVDTSSTLGRQHRQPDVRIGGAGRRVPDDRWRDVRGPGVAEVPGGDRGLVDTAHGDVVAVRAPPVTAPTTHLLGRDELGPAPGDAALDHEGSRHAGCARPGDQLDEVERVVADVGDPAPVRGQPRVEGRPGGRVGDDRARAQVEGVQAATDAGRHDLDRSVRGVRGDAAGDLSGSLPASALLRGQVRVVSVELSRVEDGTFAALPQVELPQRGDRILGSRGTQEQHPFTVRAR